MQGELSDLEKILNNLTDGLESVHKNCKIKTSEDPRGPTPETFNDITSIFHLKKNRQMKKGAQKKIIHDLFLHRIEIDDDPALRRKKLKDSLQQEYTYLYVYSQQSWEHFNSLVKTTFFKKN